jgi:arginyl-tRNA synthetase
MSFKKEILKLLKDYQVNEDMIEIPPEAEMGDYALPCFAMAKKLKKSPDKIAEDILKKLKPNKNIKKIEAKGPYLNFFVNKDILAEKTLKEIHGNSNYGNLKEKKSKIMVEYSSPNTNKPLHLGHLRNISLGESVSRVLESQNNKIIRACLINDRGIHISKSMIAYKKFGKNKKPDKKPDHFVGDFYVLFNKKSKDNPELEKEAQELLVKWEKKDKDTIKLWKKMNSWVYQGFNETYSNFGIKFDKLYYESDLYLHGKEIILKNLNKKFLEKDDGAIVARLEKYNLPDKVLIRADGTTIYMTQDLFLAKKKFDDFKLDSSIYVVGSEQNLHFKQLFKILELLEYEWAKNCHHLSYGMVYLPEGKMKSREGNVVDADDFIKIMIGLAEKEIKKRNKIPKKELEKRANKIGLGALKFYLLKTDPNKDMNYDPKESISFEGETGPYVQYTYARISSILRKDNKVSDKIDFSLFGNAEKQLIKKLGNFPETISKSAESLKPSYICNYLTDLCSSFNEYYHKYPILKSDEGVKKARLLLISCIRIVIKKGLFLLGIDTLEKM